MPNIIINILTYIGHLKLCSKGDLIALYGWSFVLIVFYRDVHSEYLAFSVGFQGFYSCISGLVGRASSIR